MTWRWWGRAALAAACLPALAGCSTSKYSQRIASLEQENQSLSQQNQELQAEKRALQTQIARMAATPERPAAMPAPAPKADTRADDLRREGFNVSEAGGNTVVNLDAAILFDSGSATLTKSGKETLTKLAGVLKSKYGGARYRVEGHTDNQPIKLSKFRSNWELSAERAVTVLECLTKEAGIDEKKLEVVGFSDTKPVSDNASDAGRKKNRRVEIVIVE